MNSHEEKGMERFQEIQREIDQTRYWDAEVFDFRINYFGDEIILCHLHSMVAV